MRSVTFNIPTEILTLLHCAEYVPVRHTASEVEPLTPPTRHVVEEEVVIEDFFWGDGAGVSEAKWRSFTMIHGPIAKI